MQQVIIKSAILGPLHSQERNLCNMSSHEDYSEFLSIIMFFHFLHMFSLVFTIITASVNCVSFFISFELEEHTNCIIQKKRCFMDETCFYMTVVYRCIPFGLKKKCKDFSSSLKEKLLILSTSSETKQKSMVFVISPFFIQILCKSNDS